MALLMAGALCACSREARTLDADQPETAPGAHLDARAQAYAGNLYQAAQGGRYFTWYGCGACHGANARGVRALDDGRWVHGGRVVDIYRFIAAGHGEGGRIPAAQLWQIAGYLKSLDDTDPKLRRRQDLDQAAEPQGPRWTGPQR
ncbi:cytochrome c [Sphingomonas morindae]|uniref:Cytochrome c n=1 Tax=Sphingomonas morindae TaxID=1541170 RepID=A0ABY4X6W0_9SPHN|nr:cytochrome c [Sphingomonas morindae]USI72335.1 cytochrome c [Sphingomonas morindae]